METSSNESSVRTMVSFQVFSPNLLPEDVARNLGEPDHLHRLGDYPHNDLRYSAYKHGMWSIDSKVPVGQPLEVHLDSLLSILEPKQGYIKSLGRIATVDFYCDLFGQIGFQLSPQILKRIADLGAALGVTVYP